MPNDLEMEHLIKDTIIIIIIITEMGNNKTGNSRSKVY